MRSYFSLLSYPLLGTSVSLVASILVGHFSHGVIPPLASFIISLNLLVFTFLAKKAIKQTILIYLTVFFIGFTLTNIQTIHEASAPSYYSYHDLSSLDRIKLKTIRWRQNIEQSYQKSHITQQELAIISAMTLGDKSHITHETRTNYSISGASHILAVSGLHISIIFQLILLLGGKRRRHPYIPVACALICIWAYTLFIGMPASSVRASSMLSIYSAALLMGRKRLSINGLLLAAIAMLIYSPNYLFDISFQLSFLAVFSILLLYPVLGKNVMWVSLAAQIGTMPITAYYFGRISCYSLLTNLIAIPAATLILYLAVLFMLCHPLPMLQEWMGWGLAWVAKITNTSLSWIAHLPGASIEGIKINILQLCLAYGVIVAGYLLIRKFRQFHLHRSHLSSYDKADTLQEDQTEPSDYSPKMGRHTLSS